MNCSLKLPIARLLHGNQFMQQIVITYYGVL
jgi:hypothetical protein